MKVHHKMHQSAGELSELLSFPLDYCYKMNHRKRGLCLIFDQEAFTQLPERKGTKFDRIRLWDTFTALQFEVRLFGNQPKQEIMRILEKVANSNHAHHDCMVIVILSHGEIRPFHNDVAGETILNHDMMSHLYANDEAYSVQSVCGHFTDERCPTLANKPKILLIQACQHMKREHNSTLLPSAQFFPQKDFVICYSTSPGLKSFRATGYGSWFIQTLCDKLDERGTTEHLLRILTRVSHTVFNEYESYEVDITQKKQIPCIVTRLTKLVIFSRKKPNLLTRLVSCYSPMESILP